jgi:type III pantothenate kinase
MLLAIDIGNTKISIGIFKNNKIIFKGSIDTIVKNNYDNIAINIIDLFISSDIDYFKINNAIFSSVVPDINNNLILALKKIFQDKIKIIQIGKDIININIENCTANPSEVGHDRLVNSVAAVKIFNNNIIIIDFGTAITVDIINNSQYIGGLIMPGIDLSLNALHNNTAKLPNIKFAMPKEIIGNSTKSAILSGIYFSNYFAIKNIISSISSNLSCNMKVVFTGGYSIIFKNLIDEIKAHYEPDLCLKGLNIIYNNNL